MDDDQRGEEVKPEFRLATVLARQKDIESSYSGLEARITEAWERHTGEPCERPPVGRRKLRELAEDVDKADKNVVVSVQQLRALDVYLARFNEGLAHRPIFSRPDLLRTLAEGGKVVFLVGSKMHENRVDLSQWDVLSMAEIQRGVNQYMTSVHFDLRDVLLEEDPDAARAYTKEPWSEVLESGGPSVVCIGSPRASHSAEVMLSLMFDVSPFTPSPSHDEQLPFHFVRPSEPGREKIPSRFAIHADDIRALDPGAAKEVDQGAHAICIGDEVRLADRHDGDAARIRTFGVVVVQRRAPGKVWTVIAGLTGAATHACAQALEQMHASLLPTGSSPSSVYWAVVEAYVQEDPRHPGRGIHTVVRHHVLGELRRWEP